MTNEQLDALMRKVFNDAEPGDTQLLATAQGDAIGREEVVLSNLKTSLGGLGDIPECQLSSDHLREAILSRGVTSDRVSPFANWWKFAVPVAACAALAAVFMMNPGSVTPGNGNNSAVQVADSSPVDSPAPSLDNSASLDDLAAEPAPQAGLVTPPPTTGPRIESPAPAAKQSSARRTRKQPFARPLGMALAQRSTPEAGSQLPGGGGGMATMSMAAFDAAPKSSAVSRLAAGALKGFESQQQSPDPALRDSGKAADSKVVIVAAGTDPQTRASAATEVDKKNVVFGG